MRTGGSNSRDKGTATGMMAPAHTPAAVSDCKQGGKQVLMDDNDGIPWPYPALIMTTIQCHHHQLLYSKEPAIVGLPRCRSCYMMGDGGLTHTHLTHRLWVQVHSKAPTGYLCGSLQARHLVKPIRWLFNNTPRTKGIPHVD